MPEASPPARFLDRLQALRAVHAPDPRLEDWEVSAVAADGELRLEGWAPSSEAVADLRALADEAGAACDVQAIPDPGIGPAIQGIAHRAVAHLRRAPSHVAELVTQLAVGEEARVLRARGEWLRVQTTGRYVAWVHQGSIVCREPANPEAFLRRLWTGDPEPGTWIVVGRNVLVREGPGSHDPPVAELAQGGRVRIPPRGDGVRLDALEIRLPDGLAGWVPANAAVPWEQLAERFTPTGRAILDHAAQFLGVPYLWGGTTEKGFDCSGFVQRIYGLHGIRLPRDTDQQSEVGEPVEAGSGWTGVAEGDLAFFSETPGRATHVGILAAGGRLLHCSTTRHGVAWDVLDPAGTGTFGARLAAMLTGIRRLLPA